jgi:CRISPR-associated protein Cmr1
MSLNQAIFTLKTVTPLFLSGADGEIPELRAPSFRGALRFWLRALLGATIGNDRDNLYKRESEVFGNTSSASPLVVRVSELASLNTKAHRVLPHSNQKTFSLPSYDAGQSFNLTLTNRSGQARLPDEAIAALLMLLSFGGVGKRARRGFGSLGLIQSVYQELLFQKMTTTLSKPNLLMDNSLPSI